jgi:hypothetical protein
VTRPSHACRGSIGSDGLAVTNATTATLDLAAGPILSA